jgi:hypothetical protein
MLEQGYRLLESTSRQVVEDEVSLWMRQGWKPQGGVAVTCLPAGREYPPIYTVHYVQAMTLKEKEVRNE